LQRGLIAATCVLFFALTFRGMDSENNHWVFVAVAVVMIWRLFTNDEPEKPSTRSFAYFQGLVILLGVLVVYTFPLLPQNGDFRPAAGSGAPGIHIHR